MFSGIECARKAWDCIHNAAMELWGVTTGVKFTCAATWLASLGFLLRCDGHWQEIRVHFFFAMWDILQVENDRLCQEWMATLYPDTCIFNDVMDLIQNKVPEDKLLKPSEIKFKEKAFCMTHGRECKIPLCKETRLVLGAPCILFSRFTESNLVFLLCHCPMLRGQSSHTSYSA